VEDNNIGSLAVVPVDTCQKQTAKDENKPAALQLISIGESGTSD